MSSLAGRYLGLIRFSHTVFALPFALTSAVLAWQPPGVFSWRQLVGILLCMVFARSAAMAFNRYVDRAIDAGNPRTAGRHLPAGLLTPQAVLLFLVGTSLLFVASTLIFLPNRWPLWLSLPVLLFLCGYSYAKRWTALCHYWLGAALMLAPLAAWLAIRGTLDITPLLLGLSVLFWVGGFDIIYACQDFAFDRQAGLHSLPARLGLAPALRVAALSHLLTLATLLILWWAAGLGPIFLTGVLFVGLLLAYEHFILRPDDLTRVNVAFLNVNAAISLGLFAVTIADRLFPSPLG